MKDIVVLSKKEAIALYNLFTKGAQILGESIGNIETAPKVRKARAPKAAKPNEVASEEVQTQTPEGQAALVSALASKPRKKKEKLEDSSPSSATDLSNATGALSPAAQSHLHVAEGGNGTRRTPWATDNANGAASMSAPQGELI